MERAINSNYINRIAKESGLYQNGVFYCKTAFDGLKTMNTLMSEQKEEFVSQWRSKVESWQERNTHPERPEIIPRSNIVPVSPPIPPHINQRIRIESPQIDLQEVWKFLNKKSLFVLSWGMRGKSAEDLSELSYYTARRMEKKDRERKTVCTTSCLWLF